MDYILLFLQFTIFVCLIICYFLIKNLLPSYFSEKGKNLATKEDVEEITGKIKIVESKINIKEKGAIDYDSFKRKLILDYFGSYNHWERIVINSSANYDDDCKVKNSIIIAKINEAKFNYNLREGEIEIFISDDEFYKLRGKISSGLLRLQQQFEIHTFKMNNIIRGELDLNLRRQKYNDEISSYNVLLFEKLKELRPDRNNLIIYLEKILKESFE